MSSTLLRGDCVAEQDQAQTIPGDSEKGAQSVAHPSRVISCRSSSKLCSAAGNKFRLASGN